ncbi:RidA family protein [Haladaptatus sp. DYSN1]|uniref:RidA family protein n=1 Tax=unclassified Haladaptatus TaxID=2622732 RepID=UPI0024060E73|nr:RidA family protein [Haladaptatus sp. DYSN1]
MKKTVIAPEESDMDSEIIDTTASSLGVVTHHETYREVTLSGLAWPEDDTAPEQVRTLLGFVQMVFDDILDATLDDITHTTFYVRDDALTPVSRTAIHEVRHEFFSLPHFPASTMVGMSNLALPGALVELQIEATIPEDGWDVETVELPEVAE